MKRLALAAAVLFLAACGSSPKDAPAADSAAPAVAPAMDSTAPKADSAAATDSTKKP
ncbi:MAG TPA: hypothetical protein VGQ52_02015 [Gemmatimonadaceae bacterium]|jgi:predicted small lipoprotein YifL|nr:hypothetical protein [Gemmatimonadaceae bacterium]